MKKRILLTALAAGLLTAAVVTAAATPAKHGHPGQAALRKQVATLKAQNKRLRQYSPAAIQRQLTKANVHFVNDAIMKSGKLDPAKPPISCTRRPRAAASSSWRRSTSSPTPTRTRRRTPIARVCSAARSTARCSATRRGCRSTTTCTSGCGSTTRAGSLRAVESGRHLHALR